VAYAGDVATPAEKLPKEKHIDEFKMEACIVTVEISWDAGRDWKYRNDFFLKYLKQIRSLYSDDVIIKYVDFNEFSKFTILMNRDYCLKKRYEVIRNVFNSVQRSDDHSAMMGKISAFEGYFNTLDPRDVSGGMFKDDYVRTLDHNVIKKCLFAAELTDMTFDSWSDDETWYLSDLLRIYREYAFPFVDVTYHVSRIRQKVGENDHKGDVFFLLGRDCQNGRETINNFLYWTSKLAKGKIKQTTFSFIKNPDPQKYLDGLSH
jgi:hypothetical protein